MRNPRNRNRRHLPLHLESFEPRQLLSASVAHASALLATANASPAITASDQSTTGPTIQLTTNESFYGNLGTLTNLSIPNPPATTFSLPWSPIAPNPIVPDTTHNAFSLYAVTIDWGDGTTSTNATLVQNSNGGYDLYATHQFTAPGNYTISASVDLYTAPNPDYAGSDPVSQPTKSSITLTNAATVTTPANQSAGTTVMAIANQRLNSVYLGNFKNFSFVDSPSSNQIYLPWLATIPTDINPQATMRQMEFVSISIDWGDGTPTIDSNQFAFVIPQSDGSYNLYASHTYASAGSYQIAATITNQLTPNPLYTGSDPFTGIVRLTDSFTSTAQVSGESTTPVNTNPVTPSGPSTGTNIRLNIPPSSDLIFGLGYLRNISVPQAINDNPSLPIVNYLPNSLMTVTSPQVVQNTYISIDWGDGTTSDGASAHASLIYWPNDGYFVETKPHMYATNGTYQIKVSVETELWSLSPGTTPTAPTSVSHDGFTATLDVEWNNTPPGTTTPVTSNPPGTTRPVTPPPPGGPTSTTTKSSSPPTIQFTAAKKFAGTLTTITPPAGRSINANRITIHWGDGTTSTGSAIHQKNGTWALQGNHTYSKQAHHTITITWNYSQPTNKKLATPALLVSQQLQLLAIVNAPPQPTATHYRR